MQIISAEWLKYRRTATPWLVILGPLGLLALVGIPRLLVGWGRDWSQFMVIVGNWWPVLWVPFGAALLAALAAFCESHNNGWRALRVRPVSPAALYAGKWAVLAIHSLLSALLLAAAVLLAGAIAYRGQPIPWLTVLGSVLLPALLAMPLLAIYLWLAVAKGFAPTMALSVAGFLAGIFAAEQPSWVLVPWAWPVRVNIAIVGVHANGIPLEPGHPLGDASVLPVALVLAILATAVFLVAGMRWFAHQEVN